MTDSPYCPWCPSQPETVEHFLLWCPRYHCTDCSPCGRTHFWIRNEVVSSLSLQMVIYFSALFFPCWLVTSLVMMTLKFQYVSNLYQFILAAIYFAVPLIEVIRLYIGHVGNLEEKSLTKTHQYVLWDPSVYRVMHTAATQPPATVSPVQIEKSSGCSGEH
ncbi:transmembrane protein 17B isoform X2 [Cherax quadricarinatus]|uniref:transmembrane protein 17B isoform X2 n=1 Tax=Cherax quadricarinatus TaxID=27406 RepID=UPI00387E8F35